MKRVIIIFIYILGIIIPSISYIDKIDKKVEPKSINQEVIGEITKNKKINPYSIFYFEIQINFLLFYL